MARAYQGAVAAAEAQPTDPTLISLPARLRAWQGCFLRLQSNMDGAELLLRQSLAELDRAAPPDGARAERAFILLQLGLVASEGLLSDARPFFEESLALCRVLGLRWEASHALLWLGDLARYQGSYAEARAHFRACLDIRRACGDQRGVAGALVWDSQAAAEIGDVAEALALARQSYDLHVQLGDMAS